MKLNFIKCMGVSFLLSFCAFAVDDSSTTTSEVTSRKRMPSENIGIHQPLKKQVFARATYDCTAKYVLSDDEIRLDFLKTFVNSAIASSENLDLSLNPLKTLSNMRELLNHSSNKKFMSWVKNNPNNYKVMEGNEVSQTGTNLIRELSKSFDDLVKTFPSEKDARLDLLCHLSSGEYALVEIQVKKQNFWDNRALAYVSSIYGNQLAVGGKWADLKKVIGVNILGGGPADVRYWEKTDKSYRHYIVQDKHNPAHVINGIELIQYSLGDINWEDEKIKGNQNLKDWLEYFKDAHTKEQIPEHVSSPIKKAYEKIMLDKFSPDFKKAYDIEADNFENLTEYTNAVRNSAQEEIKAESEKKLEEMRSENEKKIKETASKMLADKMTPETISKYLGLSIEDVKSLQV